MKAIEVKQMTKMELNQVIEFFDIYTGNNTKFKTFRKKVEEIKEKYPLNTFNNYKQNDIYPLKDDSNIPNTNFQKNRKKSFLREVCNTELMGTTFGASFSSYPSFFKKKTP